MTTPRGTGRPADSTWERVLRDIVYGIRNALSWVGLLSRMGRGSNSTP